MSYTLYIVHTPGKNVLILAAVCLSIIGGVGAYKVAQAARENLEVRGGIDVATSTPGFSANSKLLSALQEAQFASSSDIYNENPFTVTKDDTLTEALSKNFFTSYSEFQATGNLETGFDEQSILNQAFKNVDLNQLPKEKYSTADISITGVISPDEIRAYANNFVAIQNEGLIKIKNNPKAYENNLTAIGQIYASIGEKLLTIKVPIAVAGEHLSIANAFYISSEDFKLISAQDKDPLKSLLGLRQYKETVERQREMYTEMAAYFERSGIIFSESEPGYFWTTFDTSTGANTSSQ